MVLITEKVGIYGGMRKICDLIPSAMELQNEPEKYFSLRHMHGSQ